MLVAGLIPLVNQPTFNEFSELSIPKGEKLILDSTGNHVVFFDSKDDYLSMKDRWDVYQDYPGLNALVVERDEIKDLSVVDYVYPLDLYNKVFNLHSITPTSITPTIESQFDLAVRSQLTDNGFNGTGIVVGIIDNGVDNSIETLSQVEIVQRSFYYTTPGIQTHGTPVSISVAGVMNNGSKIGAGSGVKIVSARMGSPTADSLEGDFLAAFDWLINYPNMSIINTSWGDEEELSTSVWDPIMDLLESKNIILVGSAGNNAKAGSTANERTVTGPGAHEYAIAVGALNWSGSVTQFSSIGPSTSDISKPDFVQLGTQVILPYSSTQFLLAEGTSFSSPLLVGQIASLLEYLNSKNISYDAYKIKSLMYKHSNSSLRNIRGAGKVNFTSIKTYMDSRIVLETIAAEPGIHPGGIQSNYLRGSRESLNIKIYNSSEVLPNQFSTVGNISSIITSIDLAANSNIVVNLYNDTLPNGYYSGGVEINWTDDVYIIEMSVNVTRSYIGEVIIPLAYTSFDSIRHERLGDSGGNFKTRLDGERLSVFVSKLWNRGYYVKEFRGKISDLILLENDILLLMDVNSRDLMSYPDNIEMDTLDELSIVNMVKNGTSVFYISYGDLLGDENIELNPNGNSLLKRFNIETSKTKPSILSINTRIRGWELSNINSSDLSLDQTSVRYRGGYYNTVDKSNYSTISVSGTLDAAGGILFQDKGIFLVTSPIWFTNCGLSPLTEECFTSPEDVVAGIMNENTLENIFDYLERKNRTYIKTITKLTDTSFIIDLVNGKDSQLLIRNNDRSIDMVFDISDNMPFEVKLPEEGFYEITVVGNGYHRVPYTVDFSPPLINFTNERQNGNYQSGDIIEVQVQDFSSWNAVVSVNNTLYSNFISSNDAVKITLDLDPGNYNLSLTVTDFGGLSSSIQISFEIEEKIISSITSDLVVSSKGENTVANTEIVVSTKFRVGYIGFYFVMILVLFHVINRVKIKSLSKS